MQSRSRGLPLLKALSVLLVIFSALESPVGRLSIQACSYEMRQLPDLAPLRCALPQLASFRPFLNMAFQSQGDLSINYSFKLANPKPYRVSSQEVSPCGGLLLEPFQPIVSPQNGSRQNELQPTSSMLSSESWSRIRGNAIHT